jgi:hypothetical protein
MTVFCHLSVTEVLILSVVFSQVLLMSTLLSTFSTAANLFDILTCPDLTGNTKAEMGERAQNGP